MRTAIATNAPTSIAMIQAVSIAPCRSMSAQAPSRLPMRARRSGYGGGTDASPIEAAREHVESIEAILSTPEDGSTGSALRGIHRRGEPLQRGAPVRLEGRRVPRPAMRGNIRASWGKAATKSQSWPKCRLQRR